MAITKIIAIRDRLDKRVNYVVNSEKTSLDASVLYAVNPEKTEQNFFGACKVMFTHKHIHIHHKPQLGGGVECL